MPLDFGATYILKSVRCVCEWSWHKIEVRKWRMLRGECKREGENRFVCPQLKCDELPDSLTAPIFSPSRSQSGWSPRKVLVSNEPEASHDRNTWCGAGPGFGNTCTPPCFRT